MILSSGCCRLGEMQKGVLGSHHHKCFCRVSGRTSTPADDTGSYLRVC